MSSSRGSIDPKYLKLTKRKGIYDYGRTLAASSDGGQKFLKHWSKEWSMFSTSFLRKAEANNPYAWQKLRFNIRGSRPKTCAYNNRIETKKEEPAVIRLLIRQALEMRGESIAGTRSESEERDLLDTAFVPASESGPEPSASPNFNDDGPNHQDSMAGASIAPSNDISNFNHLDLDIAGFDQNHMYDDTLSAMPPSMSTHIQWQQPSQQWEEAFLSVQLSQPSMWQPQPTTQTQRDGSPTFELSPQEQLQLQQLSFGSANTEPFGSDCVYHPDGTIEYVPADPFTPDDDSAANPGDGSSSTKPDGN